MVAFGGDHGDPGGPQAAQHLLGVAQVPGLHLGLIEEVTRQTTQASKQATGAAAELTQLAGRLSELIKRFKAD